MNHLRLSQKIVTIVYGIPFQLERFHWPLKANENSFRCFLILFDSCELIKKKNFNLENFIRKHQMLKMTNKCPWQHYDAYDNIMMPMTTLWCLCRYCDAYADIVMPMPILWCLCQYCDAYADIVMPNCLWQHYDPHGNIVMPMTTLWSLKQNCEFVMPMTTMW